MMNDNKWLFTATLTNVFKEGVGLMQINSGLMLTAESCVTKCIIGVLYC